MSKLLKRIIIFAVMAILLTGCAANQTTSPPQDNTTEEVQEEIVVNIAALTGPTAIGMIKMIDEEPSLGGNVTTNYEIVQTPDILVSKLLSGEFDFSALPSNMAATLYNKDAGYQLLAMNTWGVLYVVSSDNSISSWNDLQGRTVNAFGLGATPDVVFRYLLSENGVNPEDDLTIDYSIPQTEIAAAMIAGRIDTALLAEPMVTMVTTQNSDLKIVLDLQDEWQKINGPDTPMAQGALVVRAEFARNHPEIVAGFLERYKESIEWVNANAAEAGVLVEKHNVGMPAKIAERAIPRSNIRFMTAIEARPSVENYLKVLYSFSPQTVGGKLPDEGFYYVD